MKTEIINDLRGGNNNAFGQLYKENFAMVNSFVTNNNGRSVDAEDIFQDTMMVLLEKLKQDNFQLTASIKTYIMAISKNLWLKKLRTAYRETELTDIHDNKFYEEINLAIENEISYKEKLQFYIHKITKHCQALINDYIFKEKAIEQIQKEYGYSTKHNAQNQKYKCIEQIRNAKESHKNI
ncbi:MAG: sigma-70 family RNA polymerase sigma factor [Ignavibacteriae bacterium HGW-Ignavibacteriae-4]|jgi:RNA polymerase sigma factor (sigma-70 family)|nr:MAG: sigma-70 family RNA polymerase sigma factor [Ignavibacteriae bacterium HGW-Ignavibacteriae-4]